MQTFNVLLDTNVYINAKYDFSRASLLSLKKYEDQGVVNLYTNNIINREVVKHIKSEVTELALQAKNAIKKHGELINAISLDTYKTIEAILKSAPNKLENTFGAYISTAQELSNANISVVDLFDDYFAPNAPFETRKEKKNEFPDAVIIKSIKAFLSQNVYESLHVVTDDNGWHSALKDTPNVYLYKDIKDLLTVISKEQELFNSITMYAGAIIEHLSTKVVDWICDLEWENYVEKIDMCIECSEIDDIEVENVALSLDSVEYIDQDEDYAVVNYVGIVNINLSFSYIDHTSEVYDKEDHVWYNTKYGTGIEKIALPISFSVTVLLDADKEKYDHDVPEFNDIDSSEATIVNYELTEIPEYIDDPYFDICPRCGKPIGLNNDGGDGFCIDCRQD